MYRKKLFRMMILTKYFKDIKIDKEVTIWQIHQMYLLCIPPLTMRNVLHIEFLNIPAIFNLFPLQKMAL